MKDLPLNLAALEDAILRAYGILLVESRNSLWPGGRSITSIDAPPTDASAAMPPLPPELRAIHEARWKADLSHLVFGIATMLRAADERAERKRLGTRLPDFSATEGVLPQAGTLKEACDKLIHSKRQRFLFRTSRGDGYNVLARFAGATRGPTIELMGTHPNSGPWTVQLNLLTFLSEAAKVSLDLFQEEIAAFHFKFEEPDDIQADR